MGWTISLDLIDFRYILYLVTNEAKIANTRKKGNANKKGKEDSQNATNLTNLFIY